MNCDECSVVIDEYVERELDVHSAARVATHIKDCRACASVYQQLRRERDVYARYLDDVEATSGLWMNLQAGIEAEKKLARTAGLLMRLRTWVTDTLSALGQPRLSPATTTALVLIAIGLTAGVMRYLNSPERVTADRRIVAQRRTSDDGNSQAGPNLDQPAAAVDATKHIIDNEVGKSGADTIASSNGGGSGGGDVERSGQQSKARVAVTKPFAKRINPRLATSSSTSNTSSTSSKATPDQLVREAEQRYLAAVELLSRDLSRYRTASDPAVVARLENALAEIDRHIAQTKQAVRDHPGDPVVAQYMMSAYRKKIDVLQEIASERRPE